ncbi:unnamed protein product [Paramecium sonneborni]|uniref:Uncharacterized protein n=1 Tax=Paramecium sonneborni TaxID=65129 RepID=A0A8S1N2N7_9CILI|nr:unnamed protein product [Paramecium sonneborni]
MENSNQIIEKLFQFQLGFSQIIQKLQEEAKKYKDLYEKANEEIMDHYQKYQKEQFFSQNLRKSIQSSLDENFNELQEQYQVFKKNVLKYQFQKLEFDKFYQDFQLEKFVEKQHRRYYNVSLQEISPLNFDLITSIAIMQQQLVQNQNQQFKKNERFSYFIQQKTQMLQELNQIRGQKEKEILEKIEENKKQQEDIKRELEVHQNKIDNATEDGNQNNNYQEDDNLSEAEELTQQCQECGQQIYFNHFLTKCLHYYHEECIIQKIKAHCNQTNIYCTCNSLINSRMIKDALKHQQQDQKQFTYENFLQNQVDQLIKQCKNNYTKCQCGFFYISEKEEEIKSCIYCQ